MSTTIDNAFVNQFADDFHMVGQQKKSRMEVYTTKRGNITGESFSIDILGQAVGSEIMSRHGDTPFNDTAISRRFADMRDFDHAELIDKLDEVKLLIQPKNRYVQNAMAVMNRFKDKAIIDALIGNVRTKTGTSALPSAQIIVNGSAGLTLAKLREAKVLLDEAEMDDSDFFQSMGIQQASGTEFGNANAAYTLVVSAKKLDELLASTEVKSADYNTVKALAEGAINTFMNFRFVRVPTAQLPLTAGIRQCIAFAPRAIHFGVGVEPRARLQERADKRNAWQIYADMSVGAARAEDTGVVRIDCTE